MKRLDYFNHPYEKNNTIRLVDDVDLPKSVSLYSLATTFVPLEENQRGKKNAVEREDKDKKKKKDNDLGFEPFDFNESK